MTITIVSQLFVSAVKQTQMPSQIIAINIFLKTDILRLLLIRDIYAINITYNNSSVHIIEVITNCIERSFVFHSAEFGLLY